MQEITEAEALNKAAAYCSAAEHCTSEVRGKLKTWGMEPHAEAVIARLTEEGFIDENRYAQSFTKEKIRYNRWGRVKVAQALRLKEIPADIIRKAVGAFNEEEYEEILQQLLQSKARAVSARSEYEKHGKLIRFALSRGFEMPLITRHLHVEEDFG